MDPESDGEELGPRNTFVLGTVLASTVGESRPESA